MITVNNAINFSDNKQKNNMELKGLSTDTRPTEVNGNTVDVNSLFFELDTGRIFYFDEEKFRRR